MAGMTATEILRLVKHYIGVSDTGYLGDFTYASHKDFYPEYCGLDIDPTTHGTSTKRRFEGVLREASPEKQAKIIRGTLSKYPPDPTALETRTQALHDELAAVARRLEGLPSISPKITSPVVEQALRDAETLIEKSGATSGLDRIHTALHGYLEAICDDVPIQYPTDSAITVLFKLIREQHPAFADLGPRAQDINHMIRSMSSIISVLDPIRNNASLAHPNTDLLDPPEAHLVINAARTILHYLDAKLEA